MINAFSVEILVIFITSLSGGLQYKGLVPSILLQSV